MAIFRRKVQIVAGTTYSLSLPKQWIKNNNIKSGDDLIIAESHDKKLFISPVHINHAEEITLNITNSTRNIREILYSTYYIGVQTINIKSKDSLDRKVRLDIRRTINDLSGTEIVHEEDKRMVIKVLLDKSKIEIYQLFYRLHIIIDSELDELSKDADLESIKFYEREVDRLFHLSAKIIKMSQVDMSVLESSKIFNAYFVPNLFLICKRLENISDNIEFIAKRMALMDEKPDLLVPITHLRDELKKTGLDILRINKNNSFVAMTSKRRDEIEALINAVSDIKIKIYLWEILRFIVNINEELIALTFYNQEFQ